MRISGTEKIWSSLKPSRRLRSLLADDRLRHLCSEPPGLSTVLISTSASAFSSELGPSACTSEAAARECGPME